MNYFHLVNSTEAHELAAAQDVEVFTNNITGNSITVTRIDSKIIQDAFFEMKKKVWVKLIMNMTGCDLDTVPV